MSEWQKTKARNDAAYNTAIIVGLERAVREYKQARAVRERRILNGSRAYALARATHTRWPRWTDAVHWFNFLMGTSA